MTSLSHTLSSQFARDSCGFCLPFIPHLTFASVTTLVPAITISPKLLKHVIPMDKDKGLWGELNVEGGGEKGRGE